LLLIHISYLHRLVGVEFYTYLPMKMEQTECFETSAYKIQKPGNYPEESIKHILLLLLLLLCIYLFLVFLFIVQLFHEPFQK